MATRRSYTNFSAEIGGTTYTFKCWGTPGSHYCEDDMGRRSRYSYGNRPWESFRYETVLLGAIKKFPAGMQNELRAQLIDRSRQEEEERCEAQFKRFQELHAGLSQENKDRLAASGIELHDESDVRAVMGLMGLMTLMQQ